MQEIKQGKSEAQQWSGYEVAWRVHDTLIDHTGKIDSKAGLALSVEVAALGAVVALTSPSRIFADLSMEWVAVLVHVGSALILCAVTIAISAFAPRVRARRSEQHWQNDFIYFGNLRRWHPNELARALRERDPLDVLSRRLVDISRILWIKHRRVQISLWLAVVGGSALLLAGLLR